jgi:hypothetical protein
MNKLEFAKKIVGVEGSCSHEPSILCDSRCPYLMEVRGHCNPQAILKWSQKVIAEKEIEVERETAETERVYKIGDKIKIPHAEELLMKGWKQNGSDLDYGNCNSLVKISWCGKELPITMVRSHGLQLDNGWSVRPEHLGLPKIKQTKPEPKVGEFYRDFKGLILKVVADRDNECVKNQQIVRYICLASDGSSRGRSADDLLEKVTGWEG